MKIFTSLPEDLASLSDDDLAALAAKIRAEIADARENIEDLIGQHGREEVLAAVKAAVEAVESLTEVQGERDAEAAKFEADLAGLLGRVAEEEAAEETEEAAEEAEAVEPVAEVEETVEEAAEEKVAVTASAKPAAKRRVAPPVGRSREAAPPEQKTERVPLVASADVPGAPAGMPFKSRRDLIEAIIRKREAIGNVPQGFEDRVIVASARAPFGREQMLSGDPQQSDERIAEALGAPSSPRALTASGGIAAPAQVLYDIINYAVADRPFRDGLPRFGADRGRVSFSRPQALSVGAGATGILTIADDAAATSKPVLTIAAPSTVTVEIESVSQIVKIGNLHARTWPEQVDHFMHIVEASHARAAETNLLDAMDAACTAVTSTAVGSMYSTLIGHVLVAATAMRSRHRMSTSAPIRVWMPWWAMPMLETDLARSENLRGVTSEQVVAHFRKHGISISTFLDGATGSSSIFGAQAAGALLQWPAAVRWYMYPEGSFFFFDGGRLDLGLVRDSTLNEKNDYQIFMETFENVGFRGLEAIRVTSPIEATGAAFSTGFGGEALVPPTQ